MKTNKKLPKYHSWSFIVKNTMLAAIVVGIIGFSSCNKDESKPFASDQSGSNVSAGGSVASNSGAINLPTSTDLITVSGVMEESGVTTYQYGTHVLILPGLSAKYALTSSSIYLDKYVNKNVEVSGFPIEGYPVEEGPNYFLDVVAIKVLGAPLELTVATGYMYEVPTGTIPYQHGWMYKLLNTESVVVYYLRSSDINLAAYVNKYISVKGNVVQYNYPAMSAANDHESIKSWEFGVTGIDVVEASVLLPQARERIKEPD